MCVLCIWLVCVCVCLCLWCCGFIRTEGEIPHGASGEVIFPPSRGCQSLNVTALDSKCCHHSKRNRKYLRPHFVCVCVCVCIPIHDTHQYFTQIICIYQSVCFRLGWVVSCVSFWFAWMSHGWKPRASLWSPSHTRGLSMDFLNRIWESWNHCCGIWLLSVYGKPVSLPLPDPMLKLDSNREHRVVTVPVDQCVCRI